MVCTSNSLSYGRDVIHHSKHKTLNWCIVFVFEQVYLHLYLNIFKFTYLYLIFFRTSYLYLYLTLCIWPRPCLTDINIIFSHGIFYYGRMLRTSLFEYIFLSWINLILMYVVDHNVSIEYVAIVIHKYHENKIYQEEMVSKWHIWIPFLLINFILIYHIWIYYIKGQNVLISTFWPFIWYSIVTIHISKRGGKKK